MMASKRTVALAAALGFAGCVALGAWIAGSRIESPADAAARTAPPAPSPILVPIEERVLSSSIVTRGTARFGLPLKVSIVPSTLKGAPGLIATLPLRNTALEEGAVMLTASGRPVFVFEGKVPTFRDLVPGTTGEDVRQLEAALKRRGLDPGPIDGVYDGRTGEAVARWYASQRWDPFGPTKDQIAALYALERDWGDADKARLAAATSAAAAARAVEVARATADHAVRTAEADLEAKRADWRRLVGDSGEPLAVETERARAAHAESAASADVATQIAERALVVLDPRQPETARNAADARVAVAKAAAEKAKLDSKLAILAAERDARLAREQLALAESALRFARLEAEKNVQAALDARRLAELDVRLTAARAEQLGTDLASARRKLGIQVPADEVVFVPQLPARVEEVTAVVGGAAAGPVMSVTDYQLAVDSSLALDVAPLVKEGMAVFMDEQTLGVKAKGVVQQVAATPGTRGVDGYHFYFEVRVEEATARLEGVSLRLTIPIESTRGKVLAVPTSAVSLAADGTSRVQVQREGGALEYVAVRPGLAAEGYLEVAPVDAALAPGALVVIGYKPVEARETP